MEILVLSVQQPRGFERSTQVLHLRLQEGVAELHRAPRPKGLREPKIFAEPSNFHEVNRQRNGR